MEHLPWLVVHGDVIWKVAFAIVIGVACGLAAWLPFVRLRRHAANALDELGPAITDLRELTDGPAVIEGALRIVDQPCERFLDGKAAACATATFPKTASVHQRAQALELVMGDGAVALDGQLDVSVGSREHALSRPVKRLSTIHQARLMDAGCETAARDSRAVFRSVADGDRVCIAGLLAATPADSETGSYRDRAARWRLGPGEPDGTGRAAMSLAFVGDRVVSVAPLARVIVAGLLSGVVLCGAAYGLGAVAIERTMDGAFDAETKNQLVEVSGVTVAAATPFHRDEALSRLDLPVRSDALHDRKRVETLVEIADLRQDCAGAVAVWTAHQQYGRAITHARQCDRSPELAYQLGEALLLEGAFAEASDAFAAIENLPQSPFQAQAMLLAYLTANQWERARVTLDRLVGLRTPWGDWVNENRSSIACMSEAVAARSGDAGALDRLRERSEREDCRLLLADLITGADRRALLETFDPENSKHRHRQMWRLLRNEVSPLGPETWWKTPLGGRKDIIQVAFVQNPPALFRPHLSPLRRAVIERLSVDPAPSARAERVTLLAREIEQAAQIDDLAYARKALATMRADVEHLAREASEQDRKTLWVDYLRLATAVMLRTGDLDAIQAHIDELSSAVGDDPGEDIQYLHAAATLLLNDNSESLASLEASGSPLYDDQMRALLLRASTLRDAAPLLRHILRSSDWTPLYLPMFAARLPPPHAARLAEFVGWGGFYRPGGHDFVSMHLALEGQRLYLARMLHDAALADEIRARMHHWRAALARRDLAVLLYMVAEIE